jgi:hypothetical protein
MGKGFTRNSDDRFFKFSIFLISVIIPLVGCATTAMETHQKGMESLTGKEYFVPKKPIDRHYIGCAWSKQFGPVEYSAVSDIRIKVEKSFDAMQQNFAYNAGISLGGQAIPGEVTLEGDQGTISYQSTTSAKAEAGIEGGKARKSELQNVQIINPVSLADIPFELNIPYITEALRLGNFSLKSETSGKVDISAEVSSLHGGIKGQTKGDTGTTGQGLVVAYKLHMIDPKTYTKQDSGSIALELDKTTDFPAANLFVKAQLRVIEAGANKPLPRNLLWSCDQAEAKSKDIVATWIIELHSKDPKRKSLQIAFPAFPKMEDCSNFSGVIYSRIDPLTDKIVRQKVNITLIQEEVSDSLQPLQWEAKMSIVDESFNIRLVKQNDLVK